MPDTPRISLVVPAYNEAAYLPRLLDSINAARARYVRGADSVEVIVADNASTDDTAALATARGCRVVRVEKRVIGAARNGGARIARGEFIGFIDADFWIHPDTFNEIDRALSNDRVVGGATGAWPDRWSVGIAASMVPLLPLGMALRVDIGVAFCRRADFEAIGGYTEDWLYAEDVRFLLALKRLGRRRGQRMVRGTRARGRTSTRKFDRYGDWHYLLMPARLAWDLLRDCHAVQSWARTYWYEDR